MLHPSSSPRSRRSRIAPRRDRDAGHNAIAETTELTARLFSPQQTSTSASASPAVDTLRRSTPSARQSQSPLSPTTRNTSTSTPRTSSSRPSSSTIAPSSSPTTGGASPRSSAVPVRARGTRSRTAERSRLCWWWCGAVREVSDGRRMVADGNRLLASSGRLLGCVLVFLLPYGRAHVGFLEMK